MSSRLAEFMDQFKITSNVPSEDWCDIIFEPIGEEALTIYTWNYAQKRGFKKGLSTAKEGHYIAVVDVPVITAELASQLLLKIFTNKKAGRILD